MFEYLVDTNEFVPAVGPAAPARKATVREQIFAAANTAVLLNEVETNEDGSFAIPEDDAAKAREIFTAGREPTTYERTLPGVMLKLEALLEEYDYTLLEDTARIRNYVTNRLLEETTAPDAKVRLRAYELLGKITEVALFTERSEVTVHSKSDSELEDLLRSKLNALTGRIIDGEVIHTQNPTQRAIPSADDVLKDMEDR